MFSAFQVGESPFYRRVLCAMTTDRPADTIAVAPITLSRLVRQRIFLYLCSGIIDQHINSSKLFNGFINRLFTEILFS